jgi:hypothetical protein
MANMDDKNTGNHQEDTTDTSSGTPLTLDEINEVTAEIRF